MSQIVTVSPTGRINRRDKVDEGDMSQVLSRINLMVIGAKASKSKQIKKIPGSDRYNSVSAGSSGFNWGMRYYTKAQFRRNYVFNQSGTLYHVDDLGNLSSVLSIFSPLAIPCAEIMRISENDILLFSEGIDTGMYSYDGNTSNQFNKESSVTLNFVDMKSYLDRLFGFEEDSDILYFSKNLDPTNFTDSTDAGQIQIGPKRGAKIQKIALLNGVLYIFKSDSIWVLKGKTPSEFEVEEVHPYLGVAARRSVQNVESGIIFLGSDYEFYSFAGTIETTQILSFELAVSGDFTKDLPALINKDRMAQVCSIYHNRIYRCSFNANNSQHVYNDTEYCYDTTNETDFLTLDNNVGCYFVYDRNPDKLQLVTGRSDTGFLMFQYRGLNWDNQGTNPVMPIKLHTKFVGSQEPRNMRIRRTWLNSTVLSGSMPLNINTYLDSRNALSDATTDKYPTQGEYKGNIPALHISSQDTITSRQIPRFANSKGKTFAMEISESVKGRDLEFSSFQAEIIVKELKRSQRVGV